jgi:hypothetical protein
MTGTPQGGISCVCLIALDHLLEYRDRNEKGDSQEQKTTLFIRMSGTAPGLGIDRSGTSPELSSRG